MKEVKFSNRFSIVIKMVMGFLLDLIYVLYYIYQFAYVESSFYFQEGKISSDLLSYLL